MKNTYVFYTAVFHYLTLEPHPGLPTPSDIVQMAGTCEGLSWQGTVESLELLERCCNHPSLVNDDDVWTDTREGFVLGAFKDLSSLRDPKGMELFQKIHDKIMVERMENFIWARKVTKRPDGSAVVILHVRDYDQFAEMVRETSGTGDLESGRMIYP